LAASLRSFLSRQLPSLEIASVQATFVPLEDKFDSAAPNLLNLISVEIQAAQYGDALSTSSFVLIPSPSGPGGRKSHSSSYPLLLTKTPAFAGLGTSLLSKFIDYLASRHDARPSPFRIPPVRMLALLEALAATAAVTATATPDARLTWAFPPALAHAGLASMTVTLPSQLVGVLLATVGGGADGTFCDALSGYLEQTTGLGLDKVQLAKLAIGGVLVHSGAGMSSGSGGVGGAKGDGGASGLPGSGGGGGAGKVKFVGVRELRQVLVQLVEEVEAGRQM